MSLLYSFLQSLPGAAPPPIPPSILQQHKLWWDLYRNQPPWASRNLSPLGLPSAVGRELARLALAEFSPNFSGGQRAAFLLQQFKNAQDQFLKALELGLCLGGVALKPFPFHGSLAVDVAAASFLPTRFDPVGNALAGVFLSRPVQLGNDSFVRLEFHDFLQNSPNAPPLYVILNKAFRCNADGSPNLEVPLHSVPDWANLAPKTCIQNLNKPLFAFFRPPVCNELDPDSPFGASIFSSAAVELFRQADEQWKLLLWEYQSGKRRVFVDGLTHQQLLDDIFVAGPFSNSGSFFQVFSPSFRDTPLYNGFQRILQRIEFQSGLAYGSISDPLCVQKTATEIIAAKHRQFVSLECIHRAFQNSLLDLLDAMNAWCDLANLAPPGPLLPHFHWGDGVLDDPDTRRLDRKLDAQLVQLGLLLPWEFRMKWFDEDESTAKRLAGSPPSGGKDPLYG